MPAELEVDKEEEEEEGEEDGEDWATAEEEFGLDGDGPVRVPTTKMGREG